MSGNENARTGGNGAGIRHPQNRHAHHSDLARIEHALSFVSPDLARDEWARMAMAIKSEFPGDEGFAIFDSWSQGGASYKESDVQATWRSINGTGGIGIGTLFHSAREGGWRGSPSTEKLAQREARLQTAEAQRARQEQDRAAKQRQVAAGAGRRWQAAGPPTPAHPYLVAKKIQPYGLRQEGSLLLVPIYGADGSLVNLQIIDREGRKRNVSGGRLSGCFCAVGSSKQGPIALTEGYADAASVHEATGWTAVCCFGTANLPAVARTWRDRFPDRTLIIAADADEPGRKAAIEAAKDTEALIAYPRFHEGTQGKDWNALHQQDGVAAVKAQLLHQIEQAGPQDVWEDPEPLAAEWTERVPFPLAQLPEIIRQAISEYQAYGQQPLPLVASSALATVSLCCQGHADIRRDANLTGPISLALIASAESGERKTAADKTFTRGIRDWLKEFQRSERETIKRMQGKHRAWEAKLKGKERTLSTLATGAIPTHLKPTAADTKATPNQIESLVKQFEIEIEKLQAEEPRVPRRTVLFHGNATSEGLVKELSDGYPIAAIWDDEAGNVIGSVGMSEERLLGFLATINKLWDASPIRHTRSTIEDREASGNRVTVNLMMQGAVLQKLAAMEGGLARSSGFLARILLTEPESTIGTRLYQAPGEMPGLARFIARTRALMNADLPCSRDPEGEIEPPVLDLSPEAREVWREYHDEVEVDLAESGDLFDVKDFAAKSAEQAVRIAGCFHLFEGQPATAPVPRETMVQAREVAAWYLAETLRITNVRSVPQEIADAEKLLGWMIQKGKGIYPRNEIAKRGPYALRRERTRRNKAIAELIGSRYLRELRTGNNAVSYRLNPKARVAP